jgi:hypothetical protein
MTVHGTTAPVTWKVVATFNGNRASGVALTSFPFSTFGLTKPSLARLMSVDDNVNLEIEFRAVGVPLS